MSNRTFVFGDIHGQLDHLDRVLAKLPPCTSSDTWVFLGDYLNRGPQSKAVAGRLMGLADEVSAKVVCLRGNHEDAWLQVIREGWDSFVLPENHGCLATYRSFAGLPAPRIGEKASHTEMARLCAGDFFPTEVISWMKALPFWYEDSYGIYVHAGLPRAGTAFAHPSTVTTPQVLAWMRTEDFVRNYRGKDVFFGHTPTSFLPQDLSLYTPEDPTDLFETEDCFGLDTGCGLGGFLTAIELPSKTVYDSR